MQRQHQKDKDTISDRLEEALATISAQEERIQLLQSETTAGITWKQANLERKVKTKPSLQQKPPQRDVDRDDKSKQNSAYANSHYLPPPQHTSGSVTINLPSYFGGRWTANRADYKKVYL